MKNLTMILITLICCSFCYGQAKFFNYKTVNFKDEPHRFAFPIFTRLSDNYPTNKINQILQISELELLKGSESKNIFEVVGIDNGRIYGGKVDIGFKVYDNNCKLLSIKFNQSSCGATCAYWVRYYNFNSGNGDLIKLKDLFTGKGYKTLFDFVTKRRIAQLKKEIGKLKPEVRGKLYGISGSYEADGLEDFYIKGNSLYIDGENSFSKNDKFYGIETVCKFKLSEFKIFLNNYGKSLFSINKSPIRKYRSNDLPQLFQGTIADKNILLVLNKGYENEIRAEYAYLKYGRGVFLKGTIDKTELTLTEMIPKPRDSGFIDYVDNGYIKATFDGQNIVGTWTNKGQTEIYNLQLSRK